MAKKSAIQIYKTLSDGDMSGNLTSDVTNTTKLDNIGLQVKWESTDIEGTISVQGSINYNERLNTGDWYDITFNPILTQPSSDNGGYLINLNQWPWPFLRVRFVNSSGSDGTFNVWLSAKVIGG